jgi:hypothetical protein
VDLRGFSGLTSDIAGSPTGKDITPTAYSPEVPAIYEEDIGLHGPISKLPGNNPVYVKPASS